MINKHFCTGVLILLMGLVGLTGCKFISYSFNETSIAADVSSITINYFDNKAQKVNPSLSNTLTEAVNDKFRKLTRLNIIPMDGDLEIVGEITGYDVKPTAITAEEIAAMNRLTVSVRIAFINRKHPEEDFENKTISAYADFSSERSLDEVESTLVDEIVEKLVEEIFNSTVAQW